MKKFYSLVAVAALSFTAQAQINAFAGGDFENFENFKTGINDFGLKDYATQGVGKGVDGSNSLNLTGVPAGNDYVFTAKLEKEIPKDLKEITFWIKGTSTGKSISINVYRANGTYYVFNLGNLTTSAKFSSLTQNQYTGSVNTSGEWIQVTLDLSNRSDLNLSNVGKDFFALKVGRDANLAIDVDNFQIWPKEGTLGTIDFTEASKAVSNTLWATTASFNVKDKATVEVYNINGQLVKSFEVKGNQTVNVSELVKGIYVVKTTSNGKTSTQKVVKK